MCFLIFPELLKSGELGVCKYGEKCTFAYNQMEIDVWTEEKKGRLDRTRLFGTKAFKLDPVSSIICLLQENKGTFMFLCQVSARELCLFEISVFLFDNGAGV